MDDRLGQVEIFYLESAFDTLTNAAINTVKFKKDADACVRYLWSLPRLIVDYYYKLTPDTALEVYYPMIDFLNQICAYKLQAHNLAESRYKEICKKAFQSVNDFHFRKWQQNDAGLYCHFLNNPALWAHIIEDYHGHLTEEKANVLIESANSLPWRHKVFAVERASTVVGQIRLQYEQDFDSDAAEISYWLGEEYWHKGIMSAVLPLFTVTEFMKSDLKSIYALVLESNIPSRRLLEQSGYRLDAQPYKFIMKNGQQQALLMYRAYKWEYCSQITFSQDSVPERYSRFASV